MSQGPLCTNLTKIFQKEVFQIANRNLSCVILLGGLSVNLNHLKTEFSLVVWVKQLLVMVTGEFFKNETKVSQSHARFHTCEELAQEGLKY